ncbi:hypothetical protein [Paracoccus sanguinis]|nr:hypothetical protein [Paracoccus sanguinis]
MNQRTESIVPDKRRGAHTQRVAGDLRHGRGKGMVGTLLLGMALAVASAAGSILMLGVRPLVGLLVYSVVGVIAVLVIAIRTAACSDAIEAAETVKPKP